MSREVELLWFQGCANHPAARRMLEEVVAEVAPGTPIRGGDAADPAAAERLRFPGSPTIRVDGRDVDPTYADPGDYTPRCRLYRTDAGLQGLPERGWIVDALRLSRSRSSGNRGNGTPCQTASRSLPPRDGDHLDERRSPGASS